MSKVQKLSEIPRGQSFIICGFTHQGSEYSEKLLKMGFVEGTAVIRTNIKISDPMIFSLRHSRVALRKKEAAEILVREEV